MTLFTIFTINWMSSKGLTPRVRKHILMLCSAEVALAVVRAGYKCPADVAARIVQAGLATREELIS